MARPRPHSPVLDGVECYFLQATVFLAVLLVPSV